MKYIALALFCIVIPYRVEAAVRISEVAWMGTTESQYSEWIELHNTGDTAVDLSGWKLYEAEGSVLVFTFTKSVSAGDYVLLERTTASAPDAVQGIDDESGAFGGGGFANTGEHLTLKDSNGTTVDDLDFVDGWPAGDATTKKTMQWDGSEWVTASATPKKGVTVSSDKREEEGTELREEDLPLPTISPNKQVVAFSVPSVIYKGTPYKFEAQPVLEYHFKATKGNAYWNMGDGTIIQKEYVEPVTHTYQYPGTYTISYAYNDAFVRHEKLIGTKKIQVIDPTVVLTMVGTRAIELNNTSAKPIDLSGWSVSVDGRRVSIPDMTIIAEKSKATIPLAAFGIASASTATLIDPSGTVMADIVRVQNSATPVVSQVDVVYTQPVIDTDDVVVEGTGREHEKLGPSPIRNRTKTIIFGAVALFVIGLSILLERFMARREYQ